MKLTALCTIPMVALDRTLFRKRATIVSAGTCALALAVLATGSTAATAPTVQVTLAARGPVIAGPTRWQAGLARVAVTSKVPDQELILLHFRPDYSYKRFQADGSLAQGHGAAARVALARLFAHTIFDGGVDLFPGRPATLAVDVRPGTYYLGELLRRPELTAIHVTGPTRATQPAAGKTVTETDSGYRLASVLPAHGTITIRNAGHAPHRLNLVPVKRGTTRAQLAAYIRATGGNDNAPSPSFARNGSQLGTADLSPGRQMQLSYELPAGRYAILDFDLDLKSGRPETLEGMYAIVTLR